MLGLPQGPEAGVAALLSLSSKITRKREIGHTGMEGATARPQKRSKGSKKIAKAGKVKKGKAKTKGRKTKAKDEGREAQKTLSSARSISPSASLPLVSSAVAGASRSAPLADASLRKVQGTGYRSYKRKKEAIIELIDQCPNQSKLFLDLAKYYGHPFAIMPKPTAPQAAPNQIGSGPSQVGPAASHDAKVTELVATSSSVASSSSTAAVPAAAAAAAQTSVSEKFLLRGLRQIIIENSSGKPAELVAKLMKELRVPLSLHSVTLASLKAFFDSIKAGRGLEPVRQAKQTLLTVLFAHSGLTPKILCKEIGIAPYSQSIKNLFAGARERAAHNAEVMKLNGSLRERIKMGKGFRYYDPPAKRSDCMDQAVTVHAGKFYYKCCDLVKTTVRNSSESLVSEGVDEKSTGTNSMYVLRYTLEEVRKRWVACAKMSVAEGGLGKGSCYTVSRSWFGKQRPSNVQLNPDLNGSKTWMRKAQKQRQTKPNSQSKDLSSVQNGEAASGLATSASAL
jgi:hypothetical protein